MANTQPSAYSEHGDNRAEGLLRLVGMLLKELPKCDGHALAGGKTCNRLGVFRLVGGDWRLCDTCVKRAQAIQPWSFLKDEQRAAIQQELDALGMG